MPVRPSAIRFRFVGFGERAEPSTYKKDLLYLDVGNDLRPGVIDHHHLAAYSGCTASLVLAHPDLVRDAVRARRKAEAPFTMILHRDPDLDAVASAYLAITFLTTGAFPEGAEALAGYVDQVDEGYLGATQDNPFSLYAAYMLLAHRLSLRHWAAAEDQWQAVAAEGIKVVDFVAQETFRKGLSILAIDAFACPGLFGQQDRAEVEHDLQRYRRKLQDPRCHARQLRLRLPCHLGGMGEVDALLVRHVQDHEDPERCMFFKDWARTDRQLPAGKNGFTALSVFIAQKDAPAPRCIISVKPDSNVWLRGLGALLDQAEAQERTARYGVDDRLVDPASGASRPPRPGYRNADPWYDGRAHGYTIVDAPRSGTLLAPERIEAIVMQYGHRSEADLEPLALPSPEDESPGPVPNAVALNQLSTLAAAGKRAQAAGLPPEPVEVFLSYPRRRQAWVRENLYEPLKARLDPERLFFDLDSLHGGVGWLTRLAEAVANCRVFLPVYCEEYFRSDFCQWELQLALVRDPLGRKNILVPVQLHPLDLPPYCCLIQAIDATRPDFQEHLLQVLQGILS